METSSLTILKPAPIQALQPVRPSIPAPAVAVAPARDKVLEFSIEESRAKRLGFALLAVLISAFLLYFTSSFWAPAHDGNNQNGYLVGGKLLATHATTGFEPKSPLSFVGWMWVMRDPKSTAPGGGMMYPKYPIGLPALVAIAYRIGGVEAAYRISPIAMTLAVLGMFFLARPIMDSFAAIMAMLLLGSGQVGLVLTNNPNSHASAMFCVMWGMVCLMLWWRNDRWWEGALAGFLLGYAVTIRYTEGLLLLPLLIVVLLKLRWRVRRSYLRVAVPLLAWAIPVGLLVIFNLLTVRTITGYDSTNESTGFTWDHLSDKWSFAIGQLYWTGLYFVLPLAVAGLAMAFRWNWRIALVLCAWAVPGTVLYMSYYYGLGMPLIGYLRFFTTLLPPAFLAAAWLLGQASLPGPNGAVERDGYRSVAGPIGVGIFVGLVSITNMRSLVPSLERDHVMATNLADTGARIRAVAPPGSVVFGPSQRLENYLQFAGDYDLYGADYVESGSALPPIRSGANDQPTPFQQARREFLASAYKKLGLAAMKQEVSRVCSVAIAADHKVFVVQPGSAAATWCNSFVDKKQFECVSVGQWIEPAKMSPDAAKSVGALGSMAMGRIGSGQWCVMEIRPKAGASTMPVTMR